MPPINIASPYMKIFARKRQNFETIRRTSLEMLAFPKQSGYSVKYG